MNEFQGVCRCTETRLPFFFFEDFSPLHVETTMSYEAGGRMSFSWRT